MDEITKLIRGTDTDINTNDQHRLGKSQSPDLIISDLPQQLYMSKLPADGALRLGPGQVAIVPVAFLPRYPLVFPTGYENDRVIKETLNSAKQGFPNASSHIDRKPILSPYQRADWEECMDNMKTMVGVGWDIAKTEKSGDLYHTTSQQSQQNRRPHRNNLPLSEAPSLEPMYMNERFRLTTTIIIDTNRGTFHCPFEIVSRRYNLFGLPDFIMFDVPDSINISTMDDNDDLDISMVRPRGASTSSHSLWQDDETIDDEDQRIKETLALFRAVKEKEKWTLVHSTDDPVEHLHGNSPASSPTRSEQHPLGNDTQRSLAFHGRSSIDDMSNARLSSARVVDRILQQSDNDLNPPLQPKFTPDHDCYDLYLRNPDPTTLLKVSDVLLSKSKLVNLYVLPNKHNETFEYTHPSHRHIKDWSNRSKPIFGKSDVSLIIPGDGEHHYVVTVCAAIMQQLTPPTTVFSQMDQSIPSTSEVPYSNPTATPNHRESFLPGLPEWIDIGMNGIALGFLQIKTSQGTFFISLVKSNETIRRHHQSLLNTIHLQPLEYEGEDDKYEQSRQPNISVADDMSENIKTKILTTTPETINLAFITSSLSTFEVTIDIANISPNPFTIMRVAVVLDDTSTTSHSNTTTMRVNAGYNASQAKGVELRIMHVADALSKPILAGNVVRNATSLFCSVDWNKLLENSSSRLSLMTKGALIIRGTVEPNLSYIDWLGTLKTGSLNQSNFVVEVPLTLKVVHGTVGFLVEGTSVLAPSLWAMKKYTEMLDIVSGAFFPYHPSLTSAIMTGGEEDIMSHGYSKGADHQFRIFNDVGIDVELNKVAVVDNSTTTSSDSSLCERFNAYIVERGPSEHIDLEDLRNMGLVHVRYRYPDRESYPTKKRLSKAHVSDQGYPTICTLQVTTDPPSGIHVINFVVYDGQAVITKNAHTSHSKQDCSMKTRDDSRNWYKVITGFEKVLEWFRTTKAGFSLRSILQASTDRNIDVEEDAMLLSRYFYRLAEMPINPELTKLKPVLLSVGGLEQGESTMVPLYITNYNPVPIKIKVAVGGVEGQSIALGRAYVDEKGTVNTLLDRFFSQQQLADQYNNTAEPRSYMGRFRGHPINGLRGVLLTNKIVKKYFQRFDFRDDVSMSHSAVSQFPYLKKRYEQSAIYKFRASLFHEGPTASSRRTSRCDDAEDPPSYGEFHKKAIQVKEASTGPIIISSDRKTFRRIKVCWGTSGDVDPSHITDVTIPPGGVARFDIRIRAPSRRYLPKDITQFVATGLALTTDHGELIPILVTFKALRGGLELTPASVSNDGDSREINVPIKLFGNSPSHGPTMIRIPPQSTSLENFSLNTIVTRNVRSDTAGLSLFAKSSFSRDVHLTKIESCNTCFSVDLERANATADVDPFLGVHIGAVSSDIPCNPIEGLPKQNSSFPSFFRCALDWLTKRAQLQPRGCGRAKITSKHSDGISDVSAKKNYDSIIQSVRHALLVSEWSDEFYYGKYLDSLHDATFPMKSGRRSSDGLVSPSVIDAVTDAFKSLEIAANLGHMTLETSLRAVVEYSATPDEISPVKRDATTFLDSNQTLFLAIDKTVLLSRLNTPKLLNQEKLVGDLYSGDGQHRLFFPPTAFGHVSAIKIPLRNPTSIPVRVRLGIERRHLQNQFEPPYIQQVRKSDVSPLAWANEQWWDRGGAFFQADYNGNVIRSPYNVSVKSGVGAFISTMNPSVSSNIAFLNGCGPRCGIIENDYGLPLPVAVAEVSPIGAAAAAGHFVTGSGKYMREGNSGNNAWQKRFSGFAGASFVTGGDGPASFALPYSALDEIVIPPFGEVELGPVLFRPPGRTRQLGCDAIASKQISDICKSQTFISTIFIENSLTGIEEVSVEGKALWEKIVFLSPDPIDGFDDIEMRDGYPTLIFSSHATLSSSVRQPSTVKEVIVCNDGDVTVTILKGFLSTNKVSDVDISKENSCMLKGFRIIGCSEFDGFEEFELLPGHHRSIYIEFKPSTSRKRTDIVLSFVLNSQNNAPIYYNDGMLHTFQNISHFTPRGQATFLRTMSLSIGHESKRKHGQLIVNHINDVEYGNRRLIETISMSKNPHHQRMFERIFFFVIIFTLAGGWAIMVGPKLLWFRNYSATYYANLVGLVPLPVEGQNWRAMFRSLARVNPTAYELQSIGRDQTRHMVLARLKLIGAIQPQCFNSVGFPKRERVGTSGSAGRQANAVSGHNSNKSPVNERVRMSDAIFGKFDFSSKSDESSGLVPTRLGWRCAAARGIIDSTALKVSPIKLMTEDLLRRRTLPVPSRIQAVTNRNSLEIDSASTTSGLDSSLGDLSVDESLPNDLPEIVSYDREMAASVSQSMEKVDLNKTARNSVNATSFKDKTEQDELQIVSANSSQHNSNHGDDEHVVVHEPNTTLVVSTDPHPKKEISDVTGNPQGKGCANKNEKSVGDRKENIKSKTAEKRDSAQCAITSLQIISKPKSPAKKEKSKAISASTSNTLTATPGTLTIELTNEKVKSPETEIKNKAQNVVARPKSKSEKTRGRSKGGTLTNTSSASKSTKSKNTEKLRSSEGIDTSKMTNASRVALPSRLLPPPGFNEDLTSPDRSHTDSLPTPRNDGSHAGWMTNDSSNMASIDTNTPAYQIPLNHTAHNQLTRPPFDTPSHMSQYSQPRQNAAKMEVDPLPTYSKSSVQTINLSYVGLELPTPDQSTAPISNEVIPYGSDELDVAHTPSAPSTIPSSMVPGFSALVPSFSVENDDPSHNNINNTTQYGTSSTMMDFDVMDFLDQILEEGHTESGLDESQHHPTVMDGNSTGMILNNIVPMASINPWSMDASENSGTSYHQNVSSRAAAYGIAFDSNNSSSHHHRYMSFHNDSDENDGDRDDTNRSSDSLNNVGDILSTIRTDHNTTHHRHRNDVVPLLTPLTIMTANYSLHETDEPNQNQNQNDNTTTGTTTAATAATTAAIAGHDDINYGTSTTYPPSLYDATGGGHFQS